MHDFFTAEKPQSKDGGTVSAEKGFDEFWKLYPKKVAKADARKAWQQMVKVMPPLPELLKSVLAARASKGWLKDGGEFIPYPATWLRGERWADELEVDLSQMRAANGGKVCAYCGKSAGGHVGGIYACDAHWQDAMDGKKSNVVSFGTREQTKLIDMKLRSAGG